MGCNNSKGVVDGVSGPVAEADEKLLAHLRGEAEDLRRQNAQLTGQVQDLSQQLRTVLSELGSLRTELAQTAANANRALQASEKATEKAEAATLALASNTARPSTAMGPIPLPSDSQHLLQRMQQLESNFTALQDRLEGNKAKELFAQQLKAAEASGVLGTSHNSSGSMTRGSQHSAELPAPPISDGSGLLPANNNFPSRFGGGAGPMRASRDRAPAPRSGTGGAGGGGGGSSGDDWAAAPGGASSGGGLTSMGSAGLGGMRHPAGLPPVPPPAGGAAMGDFNSTHMYGQVRPSDYKFAEQRKQGPKQCF